MIELSHVINDLRFVRDFGSIIFRWCSGGYQHINKLIWPQMKLIQLERKLLKINILSLHIFIFSMYLLYQFSSAELNLSQIFAAKQSCIKIVIVYHKQVSNIFFYLKCNRILILHLVIILSIFQLLPPHFVWIFFCV